MQLLPPSASSRTSSMSPPALPRPPRSCARNLPPSSRSTLTHIPRAVPSHSSPFHANRSAIALLLLALLARAPGAAAQYSTMQSYGTNDCSGPMSSPIRYGSLSCQSAGSYSVGVICVNSSYGIRSYYVGATCSGSPSNSEGVDFSCSPNGGGYPGSSRGTCVGSGSMPAAGSGLTLDYFSGSSCTGAVLNRMTLPNSVQYTSGSNTYMCSNTGVLTSNGATVQSPSCMLPPSSMSNTQAAQFSCIAGSASWHVVSYFSDSACTKQLYQSATSTIFGTAPSGCTSSGSDFVTYTLLQGAPTASSFASTTTGLVTFAYSSSSCNASTLMGAMAAPANGCMPNGTSSSFRINSCTSPSATVSSWLTSPNCTGIPTTSIMTLSPTCGSQGIVTGPPAQVTTCLGPAPPAPAKASGAPAISAGLAAAAAAALAAIFTFTA